MTEKQKKRQKRFMKLESNSKEEDKVAGRKFLLNLLHLFQTS